MPTTAKVSAAERVRLKAAEQVMAFQREREVALARYDRTAWEHSRAFAVTLADGRGVRVEYTSPRDAASTSIHFQFRGDAISTTGYRSDFVSEPQGGFQGTPESLAQERAEALAVEAVKDAARIARYEKRKVKEGKS